MSLPLAVDAKGNMRKNNKTDLPAAQTCSKDWRIPIHLSHTFEKPIGVTLFGAVGLQEGKDVLGDVFHHPRGESRILQVRDVLCFYHLVFLQVKNIKAKEQWRNLVVVYRCEILGQYRCIKCVATVWPRASALLLFDLLLFIPSSVSRKQRK